MHIAGGQWAALQAIAWTRMIRDYSAEEGWATGLKETFDGAHPCPLCERITEEQEKERRKEPTLPTKIEQVLKWMAMPEFADVALIAWERDTQKPSFVAPSGMRSRWRDRPSTPPPRRGDPT